MNERIYEAVVEGLAAIARSWRIGDGKESGLGRELGVLGLRGYMEPQIVHVPRAVPAR